jgi:hypothetical protein
LGLWQCIFVQFLSDLRKLRERFAVVCQRQARTRVEAVLAPFPLDFE